MRLIIPLVLFAITAYGAWSPGIWTLKDHPEVNLYTNPIANDVLTNVLLRSRWIGDTNWVATNNVTVSAGFTNSTFTRTYTQSGVTWSVTYTNPVEVTTNIVVTNTFGPFVLAPYTGVVHVTAGALEPITDKTEAMFPHYALPYYATGTNWLFDDWFHATMGSTFPVGSKRDWFYHNTNVPLGGIVGLATNVIETNDYVRVMATGGDAYWIKRLNRRNPLQLAVWDKQRVADYSEGWTDVGHTWGSKAKPNEFVRVVDSWPNYFWNYSRLIACTNRPAFVFVPQGTNAFVAGALVVAWAGGDMQTTAAYYEPTNNSVVQVPGEYSDTLSAVTTRASRAWLVYDGQVIGSTPNPTNKDDIVLVWDQPMTTYEGSRVWDNTLFPEQFDAHHIALTNMFLVPWTQMHWTNGTLYSNTVDVVGWYTNYVRNETYSGLTSSAYPPTPDTMGLRESGTNGWFRGCDGNWPPTNVPIPSLTPPVDYMLTNGIAPYYAYNVQASVALEEEFSATACFDPLLPVGFLPPFPEQWNVAPIYGPYWDFPQWVVNAHREDAVSLAITGHGCVSSLAISGLYEGSEHRAHIYALYNRDLVFNPTPYYRRIEVTPWTYDSVIVSSPINVFTNSVITNMPLAKTCYTHSGPILNASISWLQESIGTIELPRIDTDYELVRSETPYSSITNWVTNWCDPIITNTYYTTNVVTNVWPIYAIAVTDAGGANTNFCGTYTSEIELLANSSACFYKESDGFLYMFNWESVTWVELYGGNELGYTGATPPPCTLNGFDAPGSVTLSDFTVVGEGTNVYEAVVTNYTILTNYYWVDTYITNLYAITTNTVVTTNLNSFPLVGWRARLNNSCYEHQRTGELMTNYSLTWQYGLINGKLNTELWGTNTLVLSGSATNCSSTVVSNVFTYSSWPPAASPLPYSDIQLPAEGTISVSYTGVTKCADAYLIETNTYYLRHVWEHSASNFYYSPTSGEWLGVAASYAYFTGQWLPGPFKETSYNTWEWINAKWFYWYPQSGLDYIRPGNPWGGVWYESVRMDTYGPRRDQAGTQPIIPGTLLYYATPYTVYDRVDGATFVLQRPCPIETMIGSWESEERNYANGSLNVSPNNSVSVKVLIEWK